jgi:esterase/lipase superfamily enzyme
MADTWSEEIVGGKRADVFSPAGVCQPRFGILFLHGIGLETLRDRPAFTRWLEELHLACVCPHGQRSWWGDRICLEFDAHLTPERYLIDNVVPYFKQRFEMESRRIGLLGISMGGQGALRLAFKHPDLFPAAAGIASALDYHELYGQGTVLDSMYDSKEQCRQDTALMHVPPYNYPPHLFFCIDPADTLWLRGNDRLHEKLNALGIPHIVDMTTEAGGHSWDYFNFMAERVLRFLHSALDQEARKLFLV